MIYTTETVQGDLIDPITGERIVVRIPTWAGADITRYLADVAAELANLRAQVQALPPAPAPQRARPQPPVRVQPRLTVQTTDTTDTTPPTSTRGVWSSAGYLAPGTF
jgi:hypothetical protein